MNKLCRGSKVQKSTCGDKPGVCACGERTYGLSLASYAPRVVNSEATLKNPCTDLDLGLGDPYSVDFEDIISKMRLEMYMTLATPYVTILNRYGRVVSV